MGGGGGGRGYSGSHTVYRRQRVSIPRPSMPSHVVNDRARASYPERDGSGARISQRAAATPPTQHAAVARNAGFAHNMGSLERTEVVPNHYYWHNDGGIRYSHYYDGHYHWYGFYHGPNFYWTRYYGNRWWWFDANLGGRWVFWWDGFWWWAGPGGVPYVYADNSYYPYEDSGVTVEHEEDMPAPASVPAPDKGSTTSSPDGRRMAQVFGSDSQAFLYDKTATPPVFLKYLGQGVSKVRFSGGTAGTPLQVLVEYKDNTFALFDEDGNSQSSAVKSAETKNTPPIPDSVPPPPNSAPGQ